MQKAAIYVRDPLPTPGSIISKEDQENACREYCQARGLIVSATFIDTAGTRDDSTLDFIVVWKLNRFSMSLEEAIELRDKFRRVGTKLVSTTEKGRRRLPENSCSDALKDCALRALTRNLLWPL